MEERFAKRGEMVSGWRR